MFTFEPIQDQYRAFDCTIIAIFPILYFRYSITVVTIAVVTILYTIVLSHVITITIRF